MKCSCCQSTCKARTYTELQSRVPPRQVTGPTSNDIFVGACMITPLTTQPARGLFNCVANTDTNARLLLLSFSQPLALQDWLNHSTLRRNSFCCLQTAHNIILHHVRDGTNSGRGCDIARLLRSGFWKAPCCLALVTRYIARWILILIGKGF